MSDPRWSYANFGKQRVADVLAALKYLETHDISKANVQSISTAKLGCVVVQGLAGKKASVTADDFLPFDTRKIKRDTGVSTESMQILKRLMRTRKLDPRLFSTLAHEIKMASMRDDE